MYYRQTRRIDEFCLRQALEVVSNSQAELLVFEHGLSALHDLPVLQVPAASLACTRDLVLDRYILFRT